MPRLIVGRHTETILNQEGIFSGGIDIPLSLNGIHQAERMCEQICTEDIDVVFTSTLYRTKETAAILMQSYYEINKQRYPVFVREQEIVGEKFIPIYSDKRLNERSYGVLEGRNKQQIEREYGEQQLFRWRRSWAESPQDAETLRDVFARVQQCFNEKIIPLLNNRKNIMVICHQNSMRAIKILIDSISPEDVENIEFENGRILKFDYLNGRFFSIE